MLKNVKVKKGRNSRWLVVCIRYSVISIRYSVKNRFSLKIPLYAGNAARNSGKRFLTPFGMTVCGSGGGSVLNVLHCRTLQRLLLALTFKLLVTRDILKALVQAVGPMSFRQLQSLSFKVCFQLFKCHVSNFQRNFISDFTHAFNSVKSFFPFF